LQVGINNVSLDVLASKVAEPMLTNSKDFQKSKKDDKSKERKSRKDKYEKKSSDKKENKEKTARSDSKASGTRKSRDSCTTSNGSSQSRSVCNRRERKKMWSDTESIEVLAEAGIMTLCKKNDA
jgi:hypothetical protein